MLGKETRACLTSPPFEIFPECFSSLRCVFKILNRGQPSGLWPRTSSWCSDRLQTAAQRFPVQTTLGVGRLQDTVGVPPQRIKETPVPN